MILARRKELGTTSEELATGVAEQSLGGDVAIDDGHGDHIKEKDRIGEAPEYPPFEDQGVDGAPYPRFRLYFFPHYE